MHNAEIATTGLAGSPAAAGNPRSRGHGRAVWPKCQDGAAGKRRASRRRDPAPSTPTPARAVAYTIRQIYRRLSGSYGPQRWWPARSSTEVVIGAILTQNTAWRNVERAMTNLRAAGAVNWRVLRAMSDRQLEKLVRPSGTFRVKAKRLRAIVDVLWASYGGSLRRLLAGDVEHARGRLLDIPGVGRETADAILLYAGGRASFVVDAYTLRVLRRHFLVEDGVKYDVVRAMFHAALPADPKVFNEYHALLVQLGKRHCRRTAICEGCPLADLPHDPAK